MVLPPATCSCRFGVDVKRINIVSGSRGDPDQRTRIVQPELPQSVRIVCRITETVRAGRRFVVIAWKALQTLGGELYCALERLLGGHYAAF
jgi:hypothetical protein